MSINLHIRQLEAFITLDEAGSFTLAAKRLHITQPSLSNQIKLLEEMLGVVLFERTTRQLLLTEAGKVFRRTAHSLLNQVRETEQELKLLGAGLGGEVNFSALLTVCASLVPESIRRHKTHCPQVRVAFKEASSSEVAEQVSLGEVQFGICNEPQQMDGYSFRPLYKDNIMVALPREMGIAAQSQLNWEDILELPFIAMDESTSIRELSEKAFEAHGVKLKPVYEASFQSTILGMVASGIGVSVLPASVAMMMKYPNVRLLPLNNPSLFRQIGILTLAGRPLSSATEKFLNTIFTVLKEQGSNITLNQ